MAVASGLIWPLEPGRFPDNCSPCQSSCSFGFELDHKLLPDQRASPSQKVRPLGLCLGRGRPQGLWAAAQPLALTLNPGEEGVHLGWSQRPPQASIQPSSLSTAGSSCPQTLPLATLEARSWGRVLSPLTRGVSPIRCCHFPHLGPHLRGLEQ